jgi:hypothetical protein
LHTNSARIATGIAFCLVKVKTNEGVGAPVLKIQYIRSGQFFTCSDTSSAEDATIMVYGHILICNVHWKFVITRHYCKMVHLKLIGQALKLAISALSTEHAVMISFGK